MVNTLLAHGASGNNFFGEPFGWLLDGGYNLFSDASCHFTAAGSRNHTDPLLAPLANNGGPTPTLALLPGSPALDAADPAQCPATDQRGRPRPMLNGCDIGAYEFAPDSFVFTSIRLAGPASVRLEGMGRAAQPFRVQTSLNLSNWTDATTGVVPPNGIFSLTVPWDSSTRRFYRLAAP